jgi:hypothetical protein
MPLTRDFPMKKTDGEETDHPWQKSFWFAHASVNGVDFWNEAGGDLAKSSQFKGHTVLDGAIETSSSGGQGVVKARDRWLSPDGVLMCTDDRTVTFHANADGRFIDFEITLHALPDKPLVMGDNKDGTMATRVAEWMTMAHTMNGKDAAGKAIKIPVGGNGHIITSTGFKDNDAWGKRADWCDYHADHNGKTYGIAIMESPKNFRHPTWWMARDYGLFGANPFGQHDYENKPDQPHLGDYTIPAGGSLTLSYRFLYHLGDEKGAHVAENYTAYAAGK